MLSYDVWDTLLGRWYYDPLSIFWEMEKNLQFEQFTHHRKHAEFTSSSKNLLDIYNTLQKNTGITAERRRELFEYELYLEQARSFRIEPICRRLNGDYIVVSDFYFNEHQLTNLLNSHGIVPNKCYVTYDGKHQGYIWPIITEKIDLHIGDNYQSDYTSPRNRGINAEHITVSRLNSVENWLYGNYTQLGCLSRMLRLRNSLGGNLAEIWDEASNITVPILILLCQHLYNECHYRGFNKILFTERDCNYLYEIFKVMYPNFACELFATSRTCYQGASPDFVAYVTDLYTPTTLIVDLQGTGNTASYFFIHHMQPALNYFTLVDADRALKQIPGKLHLVSWLDGFTDKIEKINYVHAGRVVDVFQPEPHQYRPLRVGTTISPHVAVVESVIELTRGLLLNGFDMPMFNNPSEGLVTMLKYMEETQLELPKYINHETW